MCVHVQSCSCINVKWKKDTAQRIEWSQTAVKRRPCLRAKSLNTQESEVKNKQRKRVLSTNCKLQCHVSSWGLDLWHRSLQPCAPTGCRSQTLNTKYGVLISSFSCIYISNWQKMEWALALRFCICNELFPGVIQWFLPWYHKYVSTGPTLNLILPFFFILP